MNKIRFTLNALALFAVSIAFTSVAHAEGSRSYVRSSGSDSKQCTQAQPCRTFAGALAKTDAGGEIVALDSSEYGAVTIDKAISLIAPQGIYASVVATDSNNSIEVNAGPNDVVVLRGLHLIGRGGTNGIAFFSGKALHVEHCVVSGFNSRGIEVTPETGTGAVQVFVKDTIVRNNGSTGILFNQPSGDNSIEAAIDHSRFENNASGIGVAHNSRVTVSDSVVTGSNNTGMNSQLSGVLNVERCVSSNNNTTGISATSGGTVRVSNSAVTDNAGFGFNASSAGSFESRGNNLVRGNGLGSTVGTITIISGN